LLVAEPEARASVHRLARETGSSFNRVHKCEKQILHRVHAELKGDGETRLLRGEARRCVAGFDAPITSTLAAQLDRLRVRRFAARWVAAAPRLRAELFWSLLCQAGSTPKQHICDLLYTLEPRQRDAFLDAHQIEVS
jgi:hypothetical protein